MGDNTINYRIRDIAFGMKIGDRVEILRRDINDLYHRTKPIYGRIIGIDGSYIMVKPNWCRWVIELYPNEIKSV